MKMLGLWHGGHGSYAPASMPDDLERFASIEAAKFALVDRHSSGARSVQSFAYVNQDTADVFTPAVGEDCSIDLYFEDSDAPGGVSDLAYRLTLGPRGGVNVERA